MVFCWIDDIIPGMARPENEPLSIEELKIKFEALVTVWTLETSSSSMDEVWNNPAYEEIIRVGEPFIPFLLDVLMEEGGELYYALTRITGEYPAKGTETMNEARIRLREWGTERGYFPLDPNYKPDINVWKTEPGKDSFIYRRMTGQISEMEYREAINSARVIAGLPPHEFVDKAFND